MTRNTWGSLNPWSCSESRLFTSNVSKWHLEWKFPRGVMHTVVHYTFRRMTSVPTCLMVAFWILFVHFHKSIVILKLFLQRD